MDSIYTYIVDMPPTVPEMVLPCEDGFTVYLNARLDYSSRVRAYLHALGHIVNHDWERTDADEIEYEAHMRDERW